MPRGSSKRKEPHGGDVHYESVDVLRTIESTGYSETVATNGRRVRREVMTVEVLPPAHLKTTSGATRGSTIGQDADPTQAESLGHVYQLTSDDIPSRRRGRRGEFVSTVRLLPFQVHQLLTSDV